jgi:hypothetical protein
VKKKTGKKRKKMKKKKKSSVRVKGSPFGSVRVK